jgi:protein phosphatase
MIEVGHASHTGLRRECNEDSYWADSELGLFLVVDGIGGPGRGEVAAAIVRDALVDAARSGRGPEPALRNAGAAITAFAAGKPEPVPTGATVALLQIEGDRFRAARIGDARVYLWQDGVMQSLCSGTSDEPPPDHDDVAPATPKRKRITQAVGITPPAELDAAALAAPLERGMQFLLCTDGLTEELDERRIAATLARTDLAAQECVDHLLLDALDGGGRDNLTLLLVRVA